MSYNLDIEKLRQHHKRADITKNDAEVYIRMNSSMFADDTFTKS